MLAAHIEFQVEALFSAPISFPPDGSLSCSYQIIISSNIPVISRLLFFKQSKNQSCADLSTHIRYPLNAIFAFEYFSI